MKALFLDNQGSQMAMKSGNFGMVLDWREVSFHIFDVGLDFL